MYKEDFGVYGDPYRTFGAPDMSSVYMRLTDSADATSGSHFLPGPVPVPGPVPGMDSVSADVSISVDGWIMRHPLFDGNAPCHCVSSG